MEYQLTHQEITNQEHDFRIKLLVDDLQHIANFGMFIRLAEAMGVEEIIFCTQEYTELTPRMKRSSRSAEANVHVRFSKDIGIELQKFRRDGLELIGLEYTSESKNITQVNFSKHPKVLICGNEMTGLSQEVILACDFCMHLPMYGKNTSMNVVMATSIALWEIIH